ncbi:larval cuticle protein LCP-30 [Papilio machaon]|uniref:larval cuticle protein LCP-30 n=1 Tax=Papilio machaon TaxID=76193 RepID=UPI001E664B7F|nr:larval cuticle protein LCP-30 [Papilio machaon]
MKILLFFLLAIISTVRSEDDGRYRPDFNFGRYSYTGDARYYNPYGRYNNYYRNNGRYNYRPNQELLTPYSVTSENYRNIVPQVSQTSSPTTVRPTTSSPVYTLAKDRTVLPTALPVLQRSNIPEGNARIVSQDSDFDVNTYRFSYLTENGISAGETGSVEQTENGGTRVTGFYEYIGADGLKYRVDYTADENGFHPTGAHLP